MKVRDSGYFKFMIFFVMVMASQCIRFEEDESSFDIPYYRERVYPDGETEFNFLGLISMQSNFTSRKKAGSQSYANQEL